MVLRFPLAHIAAHFAENGHRGHDVNPVDLGQVRIGHAKQLRALDRTVVYSPSFSCGAAPSASLLADWLLRSGPPSAGDTARSADRTRPSASGKTHSHSAPASTQIADLLASAPSRLRAISSLLAFTRASRNSASFADRVRLPEWP
jgi:hypothetical protein